MYVLAVSFVDSRVGPLAELLQFHVSLGLPERRITLLTNTAAFIYQHTRRGARRLANPNLRRYPMQRCATTRGVLTELISVDLLVSVCAFATRGFLRSSTIRTLQPHKEIYLT